MSKEWGGAVHTGGGGCARGRGDLISPKPLRPLSPTDIACSQVLDDRELEVAAQEILSILGKGSEAPLAGCTRGPGTSPLVGPRAPSRNPNPMIRDGFFSSQLLPGDVRTDVFASSLSSATARAMPSGIVGS